MIQPSPSIEYLQHPHLYVERTIANGKRLVMVAEADKGELYEPILVYSKDMAYDFFGGGQLVSAYEDATTFQEGLEVYLMRIEPFQHEVAFGVLEVFDFDLLYLDSVHFDLDPDLFQAILDFSYLKQEKGNLVHTITTLSSGLDKHGVLSLRESIGNLTIDNGDETVETGKFLSLVADQISYKKAGAVYAGILAAVDPEVSPINKTVPDISLELEFSKEEIEWLREIGIVCFKNTFKKGVTCTSSSCAVSTPGSVHKHISNFRIAQSLINQVALELQPFVGSTNLSFQAMNIEDVIVAICEDFVGSRIRDYDYALSISERQGYIDVEIEIVPIFSVHSMTTHSRVRVFK